MNRAECVVCNSNKLTTVFTLKEYPITSSSSDLPSSTDEFQDCIFARCTVCNSVQLTSLIDPIKLYSRAHNSTEDTPTWKEHHRLFANFILQHNTSNSLLEVGGSSGTLYKLLSDAIPNYTIMDICDSTRRPPEVRFIQGNCESFDFSGHSSIALSHTFEHLYSPLKFIKNLYDSKVHSVFISIPNMNQLCLSENISIIHNEHTFFVGDSEIKYMFSRFGYSCEASYDFKTHSRFYHFIYNNIPPISFISNIDTATTIVNVLSNYEKKMKDIYIDTPCFICPAGHYGQKIYYYLKRFTHLIKGFIDNDISKQGLRVYGTDAYVYSPDILTKYQDTTIHILLYAGPYTDELKAQLNLLHPSITYICL